MATSPTPAAASLTTSSAPGITSVSSVLPSTRAPFPAPTAPLELRVRSYVDANCAQCHRPGGGARAYFDARFDTPLSLQGIINGPVGNSLGVAGAHVVTPQSPDQSAMYLRLVSTASIRM